MNVVQETLGFRRAGLSPALSLLMSAFALLIPPATLTGHLHRLTERSPTTHAFPLIHSPFKLVTLSSVYDDSILWGALSVRCICSALTSE